MFDPTSPVETTSEVLSAFAQDRFDIGDRFNLYVGVRMDDQSFDNDGGDEVHSSTDFAPRLAATYDFGGEGKMLLKATAGRYFQVAAQDIFNENYATKPNGTNVFTQFAWNPATQQYNGAQQRTVPLLGFNPGTFDPYYKDEASLGLEWQFVPAWALEAARQHVGGIGRLLDHHPVQRRRSPGDRRPQLGRRIPRLRGRGARAQPVVPRQLDDPQQLHVG